LPTCTLRKLITACSSCTISYLQKKSYFCIALPTCTLRKLITALQQLHHLFKKEALLLRRLAHLHTPQAHHGTAAAAPPI